MHFQSALVYYSTRERPVPAAVRTLAREHGLRLLRISAGEEIEERVQRSSPSCIVVDAHDGVGSVDLCRTLKSDAASAVVPIIFFAPDCANEDVLKALDAGADEVLTDRMDRRERALRLRMTLRRTDRDVSVNPTTRLPGTVQIERDIGERIKSDELFGVCYADLDHFKEYNDRYGYTEGDRVILVLSRILRDVVAAHAPSGFLGHIGGDDFIFSVPLDRVRPCCEDVLEVFDELIPYQYNDKDRRAGYFLGEDRRGNTFRVPVMTLSIGVVTNQKRHFTHTARVSELATEMKMYAKTLSGSVYAVDRRSDSPPLSDLADAAPAAAERPWDRSQR